MSLVMGRIRVGEATAITLRRPLRALMTQSQKVAINTYIHQRDLSEFLKPTSENSLTDSDFDHSFGIDAS